MKYILSLLMVLLTSSLFGQDRDSIHYRNGLFLEFDKDFIRDVGYKYRFSPDWAVSVKLWWEFDSWTGSTSMDGHTYFYNGSENSLAPSIGVEYTMFRFDDISLLGLGSLGYIGNWTPTIAHSRPSGLTRSVYFIDLAFAVEYSITPQLSISGSQLAGFSYEDQRYENPPNTSHIERSLYLGPAVASLIFYF